MSLRLSKPVDRNLRPVRHNLGDLIFADGQGLAAADTLHPGMLFFQPFFQGQTFGSKLRCPDKILLPDSLLDLRQQLVALPLQLCRRLHCPGIPKPYSGCCLIHQINGFIRQEPIADIALGQLRCRLQGRVGNGHLMMLLIALPDALQNLDGFFLSGLLHGNGLEPALQGRVLLNVLAVLLYGGCADDLKLSPGQRRFQDVGCVHGSFRAACADQRVQLVDKEQDIPCAPHLVHDIFNTLLELTPVLGACHHTGEIQGQKPLAPHGIRYGSIHNPLGQSFYNGGLAHARLTDETGVVLGFTA